MSKTVLIVEDNELSLRLIDELLRSQSYRTLTSGDGASALELARAHRPDLVLLDIRLPGLSGFEVVERLRADPDLRETPVVAISAHDGEEEVRDARRFGCVGYLSKPFSSETLFRAVAAWAK